MLFSACAASPNHLETGLTRALTSLPAVLASGLFALLQEQSLQRTEFHALQPELLSLM